jgi:hypothetical protein
MHDHFTGILQWEGSVIYWKRKSQREETAEHYSDIKLQVIFSAVRL